MNWQIRIGLYLLAFGCILAPDFHFLSDKLTVDLAIVGFTIIGWVWGYDSKGN